MNTFWKFVFWVMVISLAFVNPVISFGLMVLYYLPSIVRNLCKECCDAKREADSEQNTEPDFRDNDSKEYFMQPINNDSTMKSYSDDTLEDMK